MKNWLRFLLFVVSVGVGYYLLQQKDEKPNPAGTDKKPPEAANRVAPIIPILPVAPGPKPTMALPPIQRDSRATPPPSSNPPPSMPQTAPNFTPPPFNNTNPTPGSNNYQPPPNFEPPPPPAQVYPENNDNFPQAFEPPPPAPSDEGFTPPPSDDNE